MIQQVEKQFDLFVEQFIPNLSMQNAIKMHERKKVCLEKLCDEIRGCESASFNINFDISKYNMIIRDVCKMFCHQVIRVLEEREISRLERQRRIDEANRMNEIEKEFQEDQKQADEARIISHPSYIKK